MPLFLTLFWMLLTGCSTSKAQTILASADETKPLLLFQKTPCFGTCPAYNATIYENGSIQFTEFKNALAQDTLILQLAEYELQQLKEKVALLHYKELQNRYLSNWSDISSTYFTFYESGKKVKRVKHEEGGPQQLIQFQEWLHQVIWELAEDKKRPRY
ncbi:DUF6438 domain-containing protein [Pontibacter toksunensis]